MGLKNNNEDWVIVTTRWVPGYTGVDRKEAADEAADGAAERKSSAKALLLNVLKSKWLSANVAALWQER